MTRRRTLGIGLALLAAGAIVGINPTSVAAGQRPLPTPSPVVISELTAQSFKIGIGTSSSKLYSVYIDGLLRVAVVQSSQTAKVPVTGLTQNTSYTVQVEEVVPSQQFRTSPRTAPLVVRTPAYVAPVLPASPTGVQVGDVTAQSVRLSWSPSAGAVSYRTWVNGIAGESTSATSLVVGPTEGLNGSTPNPNLRTGRVNRLAVEAINSAGVASRLAEVTVTLPGTAVAAPTAPGNLTVTGVFNDRISVNWSRSSDPLSTDSNTLSYRLHVDGRLVNWTCFQYCFGTTGALANSLAPGTTYRIGIEAVGQNGTVSDLVEVVATTTMP
ncbi:MAG: fibronectin type III domain-containing protein [Ilumatobacteraceae bacterium]